MGMAEPTELEKANAAYRDAVSARQRAEYQQVLAWADRIMGPGWLPVGRHYLLDKEDEDRCRKTGERPVAAATCYTVTNGASKRHFVVREGQLVEVSGYEEGFGPMLLEPHPSMRIEVRGQMVAPHRYSLCWAPIELYRPQTADQLAAGRATRERMREEREEAAFREEAPLFHAAGIKRQDVEPEGRRRERRTGWAAEPLYNGGWSWARQWGGER
jgi:hypothetical protein